MKRHGIRRKVTGYGKIKSRELYERYGLYKVPTTAGWTKAQNRTVKNIGKPCAGEPQARFDEGGMAKQHGQAIEALPDERSRNR